MKTLIAICGPSCSGKSTLAKRLACIDLDSTVVTTTTTRPKRLGESPFDYNFVSQADFVRLAEDRQLAEWVVFNSYLYGVTYEALRIALVQADVATLVCTPHALPKLERWCNQAGVAFRAVFLTADKAVLASRLNGREADTGTDQSTRHAALDIQTTQWAKMFKYHLVLAADANPDESISELVGLIAA